MQRTSSGFIDSMFAICLRSRCVCCDALQHVSLPSTYLGHRARRPDRAVRVDREVVARVDELRVRRLQRFGGVADFLQVLVLADLGVAHVLPQLRLIGQPRPVGPGGLDRAARRDRRPLGAPQHREEIALLHDADVAGNLAAVEVVPRLERRLHRRRPDHARVQHALAPEVLHVGEAPGHLVRECRCGAIDLPTIV